MDVLAVAAKEDRSTSNRVVASGKNPLLWMWNIFLPFDAYEDEL